VFTVGEADTSTNDEKESYSLGDSFTEQLSTTGRDHTIFEFFDFLNLEIFKF